MSSMQHLTKLVLFDSTYSPDGAVMFDPVALTGLSQLLHLSLDECLPRGDAAGPQLLQQLQQLTQLTHLRLHGTLQRSQMTGAATAAAADCAALTASSSLRVLDFSECSLLPGVWQQMLPYAKRWPHLVQFSASHCQAMKPKDVVSLVRCCPNLRVLDIPDVKGQPEKLLAPLCSLTGLQALDWSNYVVDAAGLAVQAQMTGLTALRSWYCHDVAAVGLVLVKDHTNRPCGLAATGLLPLTNLRQLKSLVVKVETSRQALQSRIQECFSDFDFRTSKACDCGLSVGCLHSSHLVCSATVAPCLIRNRASSWWHLLTHKHDTVIVSSAPCVVHVNLLHCYGGPTMGF